MMPQDHIPQPDECDCCGRSGGLRPIWSAAAGAEIYVCSRCLGEDGEPDEDWDEKHPSDRDENDCGNDAVQP